MTSYVQDSRVRHSVLLANAKDLLTLVELCSLKWNAYYVIKKPKGFILENVEGLVNHDGGKTLQVIIDRLHALKYKFDFRVLNSKYFGVPQERKRIYIVGSLDSKPNLDNFPIKEAKLGEILESGMPTEDTPFIRTLLKHFSVEQLYGKAIKDKRGGDTNIHSWDLEIKGPVSAKQKKLLDTILTERRKKKMG